MPPRQTPPAAAIALALDRRKTRIVWFVMAAGLTAAVVGALLGAATVPVPPSRELGTLFLLVATPVVAVDLSMAYVLTGRMRRSAGAAAAPDASAATQTIVASALTLGAAGTSCVFFFVTREPLLLLLVVPCAAVLVHWHPTRQRWSRILPASVPPASQKMMRE